MKPKLYYLSKKGKEMFQYQYRNTHFSSMFCSEAKNSQVSGRDYRLSKMPIQLQDIKFIENIDNILININTIDQHVAIHCCPRIIHHIFWLVLLTWFTQRCKCFLSLIWWSGLKILLAVIVTGVCIYNDTKSTWIIFQIPVRSTIF